MVPLLNEVIMQSTRWQTFFRTSGALNENDDADETEIKGLVKMPPPPPPSIRSTTRTGKKHVSSGAVL